MAASNCPSSQPRMRGLEMGRTEINLTERRGEANTGRRAPASPSRLRDLNLPQRGELEVLLAASPDPGPVGAGTGGKQAQSW